MSFAPQSPEGRPVCEALQAYEAGRPTDNLPEIRQAGLGVFIGSCIVWALSMVLLWRARDTPRFRTVRPFLLGAHFVTSELVYMIGLALNQAIPNLPCWLMLFSLLVGVAGFGVSFLCRAMVYAVETQFANMVGNKDFLISNDEESIESQSEVGAVSFHGAPAAESVWEKLRSSYLVYKVAMGISSSADLSAEHLARAKRSYVLLFIIATIPAILAWLIILICVPVYQSCVGCAIFLEVSISLGFVSGIAVLAGMRIMYVAYKAKFDDSKGVFSELLQLLTLVVPLFTISGLMLIIDPAQVSHNRILLWEWPMYGIMALYWWITVGRQLILSHWEQRILSKAMRRQVHSMSVGPRPDSGGGESSHSQRNAQWDFIHHMEENADLKKEFEQYAVRQYAVENVHFVFDVRAFKRFFMEKGDSWRKQKARFLFDTYVKPNSVMEVNISHEAKLTMIAEIDAVLKESGSDTRKLRLVFDDAVEDILINVLKPIWTSYEIERTRLNSRKQGISISIATSVSSADPSRQVKAISKKGAVVASEL